MRKLQQRSTFSCTDRMRKEEGDKGRETERDRDTSEHGWQLSTEGSEEELLIQLLNVLLRF